MSKDEFDDEDDWIARSWLRGHPKLPGFYSKRFFSVKKNRNGSYQRCELRFRRATARLPVFLFQALIQTGILS